MKLALRGLVTQTTLESMGTLAPSPLPSPPPCLLLPPSPPHYHPLRLPPPLHLPRTLGPPPLHLPRTLV